MPCTVKKTFRATRKAKGYLLVQVKENQAALLRNIEVAAATQPPLDRHETLDTNKRMRAETRVVAVFVADPVLKNTAWSGLVVRIIRVTRSTLIRRARDGLWDRRDETSFYVCSEVVLIIRTVV